MGVMLTNKNWETPYYAHIGDKDKLGTCGVQIFIILIYLFT